MQFLIGYILHNENSELKSKMKAKLLEKKTFQMTKIQASFIHSQTMCDET